MKIGIPMVIKAKEPRPPEFLLLHEGQVLFTYIHPAAYAHTSTFALTNAALPYAIEIETKG